MLKSLKGFIKIPNFIIKVSNNMLYYDKSSQYFLRNVRHFVYFDTIISDAVRGGMPRHNI